MLIKICISVVSSSNLHDTLVVCVCETLITLSFVLNKIYKKTQINQSNKTYSELGPEVTDQIINKRIWALRNSFSNGEDW